MSEEQISNPASSDADTVDTNKPGITLQDISSVVEILRVCTLRGVWRINELSAVGSLYDRLVSFLDGAGIKVNHDRENV